MTYTIMGLCGETGQVGIGITTVSLAVGGLCPFYTNDGDIISSQAFAEHKVGLEVVRLLNTGSPLADFQTALESYDQNLSYRQVGVLKRSGEVFVHTGVDTRPWAGHIVRDGFLAMGNFLAGEKVLKSMVDAYEQNTGMLADRLMAALEAGRDVGGQATATGEHCTERSAGLLVLDVGCYREVDLRVDIHNRAVDELRRIYDIFKPYNDFNKFRGADPQNVPSIIAWESEHLKDNPPPSPYG